MRKVVIILIMVCFTIIFAQEDQSSSKEVKRALSYQSMVKDSLGNPIEDGKYLITFRLYDSENSNEHIWFENQNVYVNDGILNVLLGNKKRLEPGMFRSQLWVTLDMEGEESEKQYVSASSYSMYSGLVDLNAFAPSDDVHLSLDPDGRIIIDFIYPEPLPDLSTKSLIFGNTSYHPTTAIKLGEYLTMNNKYGTQIGSFMHNIASDWYKGGEDFDDFVIYAKAGRDLVLKSDESGGDVFIGGKTCSNNLTVTGGLTVDGITNFGTAIQNSAEIKDVKLGYDDNTDNYEFLRFINQDNSRVGGLMWNDDNTNYQAGSAGDDFILYSYDGRDLSLRSSSGTAYVGGTSISDRNLKTGGQNSWVFHTPDNDDRKDMCIIHRDHIPQADGTYNWSTQTKFYKNGDLGVNGNLRVKGKIEATEIEVKLAVYPDYVFKDDYNLLSLTEVEDHINSHGYLPGMPSEKEVVENGINLNEMHLKVIEKIEELTLHMIRIEKENKELRNKLNSITE